jgi:DNA-binding transcriptional LysR family regulator
MFADQSMRPNIAAISDNVETIKAMVRAGGGIAIVPKLCVASDISLGVANTLPLVSRRWIEIMLVRRDGEMSPTAENNIAMIRDALKLTLSQ